MNVVDLPVSKLIPAPWNPNAMDAAMLDRLTVSISRYGLLVPLVIRSIGKVYEVLSGNQRLTVVEGMGFKSVPCIIVDLDDPHARLLAQALNQLRGEDNAGLRAELLRTVLAQLPEGDVLAVLPESAESLRRIASLGQQGMADYLGEWQQRQRRRLRPFNARLSADQLDLVDEVLAPFMDSNEAAEHPNRRGNALHRLCQAYLELRGES